MEVCLLIGFKWKHNILLITLVLIACLFVSSVCAEEVNSTVSGNLTSVDDSIVLKEDQLSNSSEVLNAEDDGSFTALNDKITNSEGNIVNLENNYTYDSTKDENFINGININRDGLTINGNGHTIDASGMARVFNILASDVTLNNITIKNANINSNIVYNNTDNSNMNITRDNGAAIQWSGNNGRLYNTMIIDNSINITVLFQNTTDLNNIYKIGNGAGVFWTGENAIIENTSFINNTINFNITLESITYSSKNYHIERLIGNGAGIYIDGNNTIIRKSKFAQNYINGSSIQNNTISINNQQVNNKWGQGAVFWYGSTQDELYISGKTAKIEESNFTNNTILTGSGVIHWYGTYGEINNSIFTNNKASGYAGAVYWYSKGVINNSIFINNNITNFGGALYISGGLVNHCEFYNNSALSQGGAIIIEDGNITIANSLFENNQAGSGGAIFTVRAEFSQIINCTFNNNTATSLGGAIYVRNDCPYFTIKDSNFTNNTANNGGAIYIQIPDTVINNSIFNNNTARNLGGAVYMNGEGNILVDSNFTNNTDSVDSGALYATGSIYLENNKYNYTDSDADDVNITDAIVLSRDTFYVSPDGTGNGTSISDCANWTYAYSNIVSGGTIYLTSGRYTDLINLTVSKSVNIIGYNGGVVVDLQQQGYAFTITGTNSKIENITFINGYNVDGAGAIICSAKYATINNCIFTNNTGTTAGAVSLGSYASVNNCIFTNNTGENYGAIYLSTYSTVNGSVFINNTGKLFNDVNRPAHAVITNNNFTGSYVTSNILLTKKDSNIVIKIPSSNEDITVSVYLNGVFNKDVVIPAGSLLDNYVELENLVNNTWYTVSIGIVDGNGSNKYVDDGVNTTFIYLDSVSIMYISPDGNGTGIFENDPTNWDDAYSTIDVNGTIIFKNGTYYFNNININKALTLEGEGSSIIDAQNNGRIFTVNTWGNGEVTFNNLIFTNGRSSNGGAVYASSSCNFINCTFTNNYVTNNGGALSFQSSSSEFLVYNCIFTDNYARNRGGAIHDDYGHVVVNSSTFINNTANSYTGGAICIWSNNEGIIDNCNFTQNTASDGGSFYSRSNVTISNSRFTKNNATNNGGALNTEYFLYFLVYNCIFTDNYAKNRGGVLFSNGNSGSSHVVVNSSTFINNTANSYTGGAVCIWSGDVIIDNSNFTQSNSVAGGSIFINSNSRVSIFDSTFYNNTANRGSAIYSNVGFNISNSELLDNVAGVSITPTIEDDGSFTIKYVSNDNYINAIYLNSSSINFVNVSYWNNGTQNTNDVILSSNCTNYTLNITMNYKINDTFCKDVALVTDGSGSTVKYDDLETGLYKVLVKQFTGSSAYQSGSFDVSAGTSPASLNIIMPEVVYVGDNFTVVVYVNSSTGGNVSLTFNNKTVNKTVIDRLAVFNFTPVYFEGLYNVTVIYLSDNLTAAYSQREDCNVSVVFRDVPSVSFDLNSSSLPGEEFSIVASSNFNATHYIDKLQFVDISLH